MFPTESKDADLGELYRQAVADRDRLQGELDEFKEQVRLQREARQLLGDVKIEFTAEEIAMMEAGPAAMQSAREYFDELFGERTESRA